MGAPSFMDEIDCGNFFDDLLDFPDDNNGDGELIGGNDSFPAIWTADTGAYMFSGSDDVFSGKNSDAAADHSAELLVPYEDIVQLEWLSTFVEDSFSGGSTGVEKEHSSITKDISHKNNFRTASPVSVLESSSSCSGGKTMPMNPKTLTSRGRGRPRSKRPRPETFNPQPSIQLMSPTSSFTDTPRPFLSRKSSDEDYRPLMKIPKSSTSVYKKKKTTKLSSPSLDNGETNQNFQTSQAAARKCMHCEITKTPQWRAGPMGPKTLCNACGVRYKSGRLFPEYRPAASPTFVPTIHSNSHRKVVEMRTKGCENDNTPIIPEPTTPVPELIPNRNPVLEECDHSRFSGFSHYVVSSPFLLV